MRDELIHIVKGIEPHDSIEKEHIQFVLKWIASGAPLYRVEKPATPPTHLVSYCVKIDPQTRKILLTEHLKSGLWLPTGGHIEPEEHPHNAAIREMHEEISGNHALLKEDPFFITVTETVGSTKGHTDVSLWYLFKGQKDEPLSFDESEFKSVKWFDFDQVPFDQADPNLQRFLAKLQAIMPA